MWIQRMIFPCVSVTDFISLLVVVCILLTIGVTFGVNNNKRQLNFRKTCSCKWTRRRAYWLQKSVSRADYIALALRSKTLPVKDFTNFYGFVKKMVQKNQYTYNVPPGSSILTLTARREAPSLMGRVGRTGWTVIKSVL